MLNLAFSRKRLKTRKVKIDTPLAFKLNQMDGDKSSNNTSNFKASTLKLITVNPGEGVETPNSNKKDSSTSLQDKKDNCSLSYYYIPKPKELKKRSNSLVYKKQEINRINTIDLVNFLKARTPDESTSKINIMICDDDNISGKLLIKQLNKCLADKKIAPSFLQTYNGLECLYQMHQNYSKNIVYQLLLIDHEMPILNGTETIGLIQKLNFKGFLNRPIMYLTTGYDENIIKGMNYKNNEEEKCDGYLQKPIKKQQIVDLIQRLIDQKIIT